MSVTQTTILLIVGDQADAQRVQQALIDAEDNTFHVEWVTNIPAALARLQHNNECHIEILLLDVALADSQLDVFDQLTNASPGSIILALGENKDKAVARQLLDQGAHDYFSKMHIDSYWLPRALRYVTERKINEMVVHAAEEALFEEKERTEVTLNSIGDAVITADQFGNITRMNFTAENMTGWASEDALGRPLAEIFNIVDGETRETICDLLSLVNNQDDAAVTNLNWKLIRQDNSECAIESSVKSIKDRDSRFAGAIIVFHDVSESRTMTQKMTHLAQHDFLTGLPNRMLLTERLSQAIGLAHRNRTRVALLFIDLDFFKHINDSLGHAVGDELLQSVAERLVSCVRATDTVCRQGGDEFVILLTEIERSEDAAVTAEKLFSSFSVPHVIGVHELHVSLSIGISVFPGDGKSAEALMQNADAAMYHAKAIGRNNFQFFKMEMNAKAVQRAFIEASLRRAIKQQEFVLHYQPKMDIASGNIIGAEALIRWQDPKLGLIYPADFLAIAEECGLIVAIGGWVLREVCRQLRAWLREGLRIIPLAINISAAELKHKYFLDGISQVLQEAGLPAYYLELEFTETILMRDAELSVTLLEALKEKGVQLTIDDFGTGYSSLSYLQRFPVDTLKIDRSFMRDLSRNTDNATIVSAIIDMGRNLKQRVLAEGVETEEQFTFLRNHRCNEVQGSYVGNPLVADDFARLLTRNPVPALSVRQRTDPL